MPKDKIPFSGFGELVVASDAAALAFPPVFVGDAGSRWNTGRSVPAQLDLELWADLAVDITDAQLMGASQMQIEIASDDVNVVDFANNELDVTTHGLTTGHGPIQFTTTGTLPTGIELLTDYWAIVVNSGTIKIATSLEDAVEGTAVTFSDVGSGTHSFLGSETGKFMTGSNNSFEIRWLSFGLLGDLGDGVISLSVLEGYTTRVLHRPRTVMYGVVASYTAGPLISVSMYPVHGRQ